jgi:hypothetical protein
MPRLSKESTGKLPAAATAFTGQTLTKTSAQKGFGAALLLHAKRRNRSPLPNFFI